MRVALFLIPAALVASTCKGDDVSVDKAQEAVSYLIKLSKVCLTYGLKNDKYPLGESPLGIDWLRESKNLERFQKAVALRNWRSKDKRFSVEATYISSTPDTVTLRTDKGKVGTVAASKLDPSSAATLSFIQSYSEDAIALAEVARGQIAAQKPVTNPGEPRAIGVLRVFCDADYLRSVGFDQAAAQAESLDRLLQQLTSDEQKALWHVATIRLLGNLSQTKLVLMLALKHAPAELILTIKAEEEEFERAMEANDRKTVVAIQQRRRSAGISIDEYIYPVEYSNAKYHIASLSTLLADAAQVRLDSRKHPQPLSIEALSGETLRAVQAAQRRELSKQELTAVKSYVEAHFAEGERDVAIIRLCADIIRTRRIAAKQAERGEIGDVLTGRRRPKKVPPVDVGAIAGELAEYRALFDDEVADRGLR